METPIQSSVAREILTLFGTTKPEKLRESLATLFFYYAKNPGNCFTDDYPHIIADTRELMLMLDRFERLLRIAERESKVK